MQHLLWGNCEDEWMLEYGYCDRTCGRCVPAYLKVNEPSPSLSPSPAVPGGTPGRIICTQDAHQCADGSWVGRTGPTCAFECPSPSPSPSPSPRPIETQTREGEGEKGAPQRRVPNRSQGVQPSCMQLHPGWRTDPRERALKERCNRRRWQRELTAAGASWTPPAWHVASEDDTAEAYHAPRGGWVGG